jgi:hypothetical protein
VLSRARFAARFREEGVEAAPRENHLAPSRNSPSDGNARRSKRIPWHCRDATGQGPERDSRGWMIRSESPVSAVPQRGAVRTLRDDSGADEDDAGGNRPPRDESAGEHDDFNVHANVAIAADDDLGRERLMRWRSPTARARRTATATGRPPLIPNKAARRPRQATRNAGILARLAALVPPPRYPVLHYSGVLGPRSTWPRNIAPRLSTKRSRATLRPRRRPSPATRRREVAGPRRAAAVTSVVPPPPEARERKAGGTDSAVRGDVDFATEARSTQLCLWLGAILVELRPVLSVTAIVRDAEREPTHSAP